VPLHFEIARARGALLGTFVGDTLGIKGKAAGHGVALIKHAGHVVKTRRWSAMLTLD